MQIVCKKRVIGYTNRKKFCYFFLTFHHTPNNIVFMKSIKDTCVGSGQNKSEFNGVWSDFFRNFQILLISLTLNFTSRRLIKHDLKGNWQTYLNMIWHDIDSMERDCIWYGRIASWIEFPKKHSFQKNYEKILKLSFDLAQAKSIASYWTYHKWLLHKWSGSFARSNFWKVTFSKFSSIRLFRYFLQNLCRSSSNISCFTSRCQYSDSMWFDLDFDNWKLLKNLVSPITILSQSAIK